MNQKVITEKQDLRYLEWSKVRTSSGTAGTFLKSEEVIDGKKAYYKLSNFDAVNGIVGHECVNEIIVDRLLTILGVDHLDYQLIHADVQIDGREYKTWLCKSLDFKEAGESKTALENYFQVNREGDMSAYDFCKVNGWQKYIDTMLAVDYLILNRDRHGANIEVLRNARKHSLRIAPLFDHGLSFLCSCYSEKEIEEFDVTKDLPCQNFIGSRSTLQNLDLISEKETVFNEKLTSKHRDVIFADLDEVISKRHRDKIWEMLYQRWCYYESLCH